MVLSLLALNNYTIAGVAVSVLTDRSAGRVFIDGLIVSCKAIVPLTLYSLALFIVYTFITMPDIIFFCMTIIKQPGYSDPIWVVAGREIWQAIVAQVAWPVMVAVVLESIRKTVALKSKQLPDETLDFSAGDPEQK